MPRRDTRPSSAVEPSIYLPQAERSSTSLGTSGLAIRPSTTGGARSRSTGRDFRSEFCRAGGASSGPSAYQRARI